MESSLGLLFVLITMAIIHINQAQEQQGFISLDCGLPVNELSPYIENITKLKFSSDSTFIHSGETGSVQIQSLRRYLKPYTTLRYFPDGTRNCYNLDVDKGRKYLIRASFVYGNYDGRDIKPVFDLHLGPNLWATINLEERVNGTRKDLLHVATSNSLQICLVKTGETTPLISTLEVRPMGDDSYITQSGSLQLHKVNYISKSGSQLRYMDDIYDRIWIPFFSPEWKNISTTVDVSNLNSYAPPKDALRNAATPTNPSAPLTISWSSSQLDDQYYLYAHFAEIQDLRANETREFNMVWNGAHFYGPLSPEKLKLTTVFSGSAKTCDGGECRVQLIRTNKSTLPPLLNAYEVYKVIQFLQSGTDESDVDAIRSIEANYGLSNIKWQGDPCVPRELGWESLNCSNTDMSTPPRITTLNLSSSGLNGTIAAAIENLTYLEKLDLSNNNLTGGVPEFLGNMESLSVINLSGNNLNGSIPKALRRKGLELLVEGNPLLCLSDSCGKAKSPKKKFVVPIVASCASAAIVIAVLVLFLVLRKKKPMIVEGGGRETSNKLIVPGAR